MARQKADTTVEVKAATMDGGMVAKTAVQSALPRAVLKVAATVVPSAEASVGVKVRASGRHSVVQWAPRSVLCLGWPKDSMTVESKAGSTDGKMAAKSAAMLVEPLDDVKVAAMVQTSAESWAQV